MAGAEQAGSSPALRRVLGPTDFTLLVVGAVVGADIYVVAGMGAKLLGPAQLAAWVVAGVLSAFIALAYIQCAAICPDVGGSYAYAHQAFGPFLGFVSGWALYLGEWIALPVFLITFINYLGYFAPSLTHLERIGIAFGLVLVNTVITIRGTRASGWVNDALTVAKLVPLAILVIFGVFAFLIDSAVAMRQTHPFAPLGWGQLGPAVVLIFWAYAGFELAVLPAGEVRDPRRTLPRGLLVGMGIVTLFYLLTSWSVVTAIPSSVAPTSTRPLSDALAALL